MGLMNASLVSFAVKFKISLINWSAAIPLDSQIQIHHCYLNAEENDFSFSPCVLHALASSEAMLHEEMLTWKAVL